MNAEEKQEKCKITILKQRQLSPKLKYIAEKNLLYENVPDNKKSDQSKLPAPKVPFQRNSAAKAAKNIKTVINTPMNMKKMPKVKSFVSKTEIQMEKNMRTDFRKRKYRTPRSVLSCSRRENSSVESNIPTYKGNGIKGTANFKTNLPIRSSMKLITEANANVFPSSKFNETVSRNRIFANSNISFPKNLKSKTSNVGKVVYPKVNVLDKNLVKLTSKKCANRISPNKSNKGVNSNLGRGDNNLVLTKGKKVRFESLLSEDSTGSLVRLPEKRSTENSTYLNSKLSVKSQAKESNENKTLNDNTSEITSEQNVCILPEKQTKEISEQYCMEHKKENLNETNAINIIPSKVNANNNMNCNATEILIKKDDKYWLNTAESFRSKPEIQERAQVQPQANTATEINEKVNGLKSKFLKEVEEISKIISCLEENKEKNLNDCGNCDGTGKSLCAVKQKHLIKSSRKDSDVKDEKYLDKPDWNNLNLYDEGSLSKQIANDLKFGLGKHLNNLNQVESNEVSDRNNKSIFWGMEDSKNNELLRKNCITLFDSTNCMTHASPKYPPLPLLAYSCESPNPELLSQPTITSLRIRNKRKVRSPEGKNMENSILNENNGALLQNNPNFKFKRASTSNSPLFDNEKKIHPIDNILDRGMKSSLEENNDILSIENSFSLTENLEEIHSLKGDILINDISDGWVREADREFSKQNNCKSENGHSTNNVTHDSLVGEVNVANYNYSPTQNAECKIMNDMATFSTAGNICGNLEKDHADKTEKSSFDDFERLLYLNSEYVNNEIKGMSQKAIDVTNQNELLLSCERNLNRVALKRHIKDRGRLHGCTRRVLPVLLLIWIGFVIISFIYV